MKRNIVLMILCAYLTVLLPLSAEAVYYDERGTLQYVADQADILTDREHIELESMAEQLSQGTGCDVLIAAVEDLNGYSAGDYAAQLNSGNLWNSDHAVLFLLAMEEREWYIATFGDAIYVFTDYGLDMLGHEAVYYFSDGRYYNGFCAYLNLLPDYFTAWQNGEPIDNDQYNPGPRDEVVYPSSHGNKTFWQVLPLSLLIGVVTAAVILLVMRYSMNTKRRQRSAGDYLKPGSYHLHTHQDIFLYSNLSKTRRQENSGHPGGGSSIHRSSGGRSHGGRGGKF